MSPSNTEREGSAPHDVWRNGPLRYAGYANEFGEAFRPLIHRHIVTGTYAVATAYAAGDTYDKASIAQRQGQDWKAVAVAGTSAALWQFLASVTVPAFFVNRQVSITTTLLEKYRPNYKTSALRLAPTVSGLALIPFLPYVLDPPITQFVDAVVSMMEGKSPCTAASS
eukprot:TRINITY_DN60668_c0_g1_i1.p2 TRINITY_DN60668_c0_g1~~TRINITY_DN60668_c0_g1_i1.p2  ORF type:complete len:168 (+),score=57.44 TRINITY_DN60668_c0_g1_i1:112-615(+)